MSASEQKILLANLLNSVYGISNVRCKENKEINGNGEVSFDWSNITNNTKEEYSELYNALRNYREYIDFARPYLIKYDFLIQDKNIIIEYDEGQHFTEPRRISFDYYPDDIVLYYDKEIWKQKCERMNRHDNEPIYRDEQRAFGDAIRDIATYRNGYKLVRVYDGEYNFNNEQDKDRFILRIENLINI